MAPRRRSSRPPQKGSRKSSPVNPPKKSTKKTESKSVESNGVPPIVAHNLFEEIARDAGSRALRSHLQKKFEPNSLPYKPTRSKLLDLVNRFNPTQQQQQPSDQHTPEYWQQIIKFAEDENKENLQVLNWLVQQCAEEINEPGTSAPDSSEQQPKNTIDPLIQRKLDQLQKAVALRDEQSVCGFDKALLDPSGTAELGDPCTEGIKECIQHQNWPEVRRKRLELAQLSEQERSEPDKDWIAKRAKFLVAGTTRYSTRRRYKAAYFIPYIWDDGDREFFLEGEPDPFWDKHY